METERTSSGDCIEIDGIYFHCSAQSLLSKKPLVSQDRDDDDTPLKDIGFPVKAKQSVGKPGRKRKIVEYVNCNFCGELFKEGVGIKTHQRFCKQKHWKHRKQNSVGKAITPSDVEEHIEEHIEKDTKEKIIVITPANPLTMKQRIMDLHIKDTQEKEKEKKENIQSSPSPSPSPTPAPQSEPTPKFQVGEYATIINDEETIKKAFSKNSFYGWNPDMRKMLGGTYEVIPYSPWSVGYDVVSLLVPSSINKTKKIRHTFPKEVLIKVGDKDSQEKTLPYIVIEDSDDESESKSDPVAEIQRLRKENAKLKDKVKLFEESVETLSASVDAVGKCTKRKSQELDPIPKPPSKKANNGEKVEDIPVIKVGCWKTSKYDFCCKSSLTGIFKSVNNPDIFIRNPHVYTRRIWFHYTSIVVENKNPYQYTSGFGYSLHHNGYILKDKHSPVRMTSRSEILKMVTQ
jgi:hypothetical protein